MVNGLGAAAVTVRFSVTVAVCGVGAVESVTTMTMEAVPETVPAGVPVIAPVDVLRERPAGRPVALNEYGTVPPVAVRLALYAAPTVAPAREEVVMTSLAEVPGFDAFIE
jgi:hypothetical protein